MRCQWLLCSTEGRETYQLAQTPQTNKKTSSLIHNHIKTVFKLSSVFNLRGNMFYLNTAVMILLAVKAYCLKTLLANSSNTFSENKIITVAALRRLGKKLRSIFQEEFNNVISLDKASQPPKSRYFVFAPR